MKIGIINNKNNEKLNKNVDTSSFEFKDILNKSELDNTYDFVILSVYTEDDILCTIDWLISMNSYKSIYSIITISEKLIESIPILLKIGANQIIAESEVCLLVIKNLIDTLEAKEEALNHKITFNKENRSIIVDNQERYLTKIEYKIFNALYENKNKVVCYESLGKEAWPDKLEIDRTLVANLVFHLREKIKGSDYYKIKTIRSKGYMLTD